ncbi:interleukin-6-like [Myripristis murdjan]|uniref:interleukin-6-like n=1 Tax=Myripristis murdjan TaxID=586833 RepID=UPI001175CDFA|nr:interleukin-6 [Myripristis murdjan]
MRFTINAYLLSVAVMLALLARCGSGRPAGDAPTEGTPDDLSGEDVQRSDLLSESPVWSSIIRSTRPDAQKFLKEFQGNVNDNTLRRYEVPAPSALCPKFNFSKMCDNAFLSFVQESCLQRQVQGLLKFRVLLKYVEREYPSNPVLPNFKFYSGLLISLIEGKMKHREQVRALTSSEEEMLLKEMDNPDVFHRRMTAHSILLKLNEFLIDSKKSVAKYDNQQTSRQQSVAMQL